MFVVRLSAMLVALLALSAAWAQSGVVHVWAVAQHARVYPGERLAVAVVLDHGDRLHTWPSAAQDVLPAEIAAGAIRTEIEVVDREAWAARVGPVQWPVPTPAPVPNPSVGPDAPPTVDVPVYSKRAVAFVPVIVAEDAPAGPGTLRLRVRYQACDDRVCYPPDEADLTVSVEIVPPGTPRTESGPAGLFETFDAAVFVRMARSSSASPPASDVRTGDATPRLLFVIPVPDVNTAYGLALIALLAVLGGVALNLTPCVLPVIPIKVITISQQAGSPARSLRLGLWMAAGVVAFWVAAGLPVVMFTAVTDVSQVFGIWWVTTGLGLLIAIMALGLMGAFAFPMPQVVYAVTPRADTAWGSFAFGVMTGVLGLPCYGFVVGALLPAAAATSPLVTLTIFSGVGVGMAAPYAVLAAFPTLLGRIPRSGPAGELVKQVMGLLLLGAAAYFIGSGLITLISEHPYLARTLHWWAVALCAVVAGGWLSLRTFQLTRRAMWRSLWSVLALLVSAVPLWYVVDVTAQARSAWEPRRADTLPPGALPAGVWIEYTPQRLEAALAAGYRVVIDFTAEWCLICKYLKATVLAREPVRSALARPDVVLLTGDCTSRFSPAWDKLRELGKTGVPLLVVYGPGLPQPWMSNAYTAEQVLEVLEAARGKPR